MNRSQVIALLVGLSIVACMLFYMSEVIYKPYRIQFASDTPAYVRDSLSRTGPYPQLPPEAVAARDRMFTNILIVTGFTILACIGLREHGNKG